MRNKYVLTDGHEVAERRTMTPDEAERANEVAKEATGGEFSWCMEVKTLREQIGSELLSLAKIFELGTFTGINPKYPDSWYLIRLEKFNLVWVVNAFLYSNMYTRMYMKQDGTFSFDDQKQWGFASYEEALDAFCKNGFPHRKREFV